MESSNVHTSPSILVTGGAGYIGSMLTGILLQRGYRVTVLDDLLFGGESLLAYLPHPAFRFIKGDIFDPATIEATQDGLRIGTAPPERFTAIVHLAAIVGFPACQAVGQAVAWRYNVEATSRLFELAEQTGVERFLFASSYSNYGLAEENVPVTEDSPLYPQSLYAETKIAAERYLYERAAQAHCAPILYRLATLFGISPRTRFDLIINQFVIEALSRRKLIIYQRGYARSFIHVRDVCDAMVLALQSPLNLVRGQVFNVGSEQGNYTKDEIVSLVQQHVRGTEVEYKNLSFGGDMRDIRVSFAKIRSVLGFEPAIDVTTGIREVRDAVEMGLIRDPLDQRYRNAQFIVQ